MSPGATRPPRRRRLLVGVAAVVVLGESADVLARD